MTNADYIRKMTDKQLANYLNIEDCPSRSKLFNDAVRKMTDEQLACLLPVGDCFSCPVLVDGRGSDDCAECALKWLKDEYHHEF